MSGENNVKIGYEEKKEVKMGKGMDIKKEGKKKPAKTSKEKKQEKKDKKKEK